MKISKRKRLCLIMAMSSLTLLTWNICQHAADEKEQTQLPRETIHPPHRLLEVLKGYTRIPYTDTQRKRHTDTGHYGEQRQRLSDVVGKHTQTGRKHDKTPKGESMRYFQTLKKQRLLQKYKQFFPKRYRISKQRDSRVPFSPSPLTNDYKKQQSSSGKVKTNYISSSYASDVLLDNDVIQKTQTQNIFPKRKENTNPASSILTKNVLTKNVEGKKKKDMRHFVERRLTLSDENKNQEHVNASVEVQDFKHLNSNKRNSEENSVYNKHDSRTGVENTSQDVDKRDDHLILVHQSPWYVHSRDVDFSSCDYSRCRLSYNRSLLPSARAVVFDAVNLDPSPPTPRPAGQLWVLFVMEPPSRLRDQNPRFQKPGWKSVFNLTMSYRWDSDIFSPYGFVLRKDTAAKEEHQALYRKAASLMTKSSFEKQGGRKSLGYSYRLNSLKRKSPRQANQEIGKTIFHRERNASLSSWDNFPKQDYIRKSEDGKDSRNLIKREKRHERKSPKFNPIPGNKIQPQSFQARKETIIKYAHKTDKDISKVNPHITPSLTRSMPSPEFLQMAASKTRSAIWLVSHCQADSARDQYVRRLQRRLDVDVYGKCSGRRCGNDAECGRLINSTYRFLLALENSFCQDYVTEKVFNAYNDIYVIPVVRGGAEYSRILPRGTYVDTSDFPSPEALGRFLIGLSKDHVTYAGMLERKMMYHAAQWRWDRPSPWCQLCRRVHDSLGWTPGSRTYPDTSGWISGPSVCWLPPDLP